MSKWREEYRKQIEERPKAHAHEYVEHPVWGTHMACRVCGFALVKYLVPKHLIVPETCDGCYKNPCECLPDDTECDRQS